MAKITKRTKKINPLVRVEQGTWLSALDRKTIAKYNIYQVTRDTLVKVFDDYILVASTTEDYIKAYSKTHQITGVKIKEIPEKDRNTNRLGRILVNLKWE